MRSGVVKFVAVLVLAGAIPFARPARSADDALTIGPHTDTATIAVAPDQAARALLPDRVRQAGRVTMGLESNAGYPNMVTVNGTHYGLTVDLGRALAATLGLKADEMTMPFSNVIPALGSGRIDMTPALVTDRPDRRQVVDFVDASYGLAFSFLLNADSKLPSLTYETVCGVTVGANTGSSQATRLTQASKACEAAGRKPVDIKLYPNVSETTLAVQSGRVEAAIVMAAMANFLLKNKPDALKAGSEGQPERISLVGSAFAKGSDLVPAYRAAMLSLYRSGAWKRILDQYNYGAALPPESVILNTEPVPEGPLPARLLP